MEYVMGRLNGYGLAHLLLMEPQRTSPEVHWNIWPATACTAISGRL